MAQIFSLPSKKTGKVHDIEAGSLEEARAKLNAAAKDGTLGEGRDQTTGESVGRKVQAGVAGLRQTAEGTLGMIGDVPGMVGGAVKWGMDKMPDQFVSPEQAAETGRAAESSMQTTGKAVSGGYAADVILKAMVMAGIISPETVQSISAHTEPPTSADVHSATTAVLPESVNTYTEGPENPTPTEENIQFGTGMLGNLIGGNKIKAVKDLGMRLMTRVAAPTVVNSGVDAMTDELVAAGKLSPQDVIAIKTVLQTAVGGGGTLMEKGLEQRAAVKQVTSNPNSLRVIYEGLIADGMNPAAAQAEIARLGVAEQQAERP